MVKVIWDDWEGIRNEIELRTQEDAELEAEELRKRFDFVEIVIS